MGDRSSRNRIDSTPTAPHSIRNLDGLAKLRVQATQRAARRTVLFQLAEHLNRARVVFTN